MSKTAEIVQFLKTLRLKIIKSFESFEPQARFQKKPWIYQAGQGGGEMAVMRGDIFEKAAVNWSGIHGNSFPLEDGSGPFFATGISLITHMQNPHAPTVHMNLRYLKTKTQEWFGGGYDLTPMGFLYNEDREWFHSIAQKTLDQYDPTLYQKFAQQAKEYFFIPHWGKERGVGGIFFDHFNDENALAIWQALGNSFLEAILPIYKNRIHMPYLPEDKQLQSKLRAQYAEFNLLYDRGTKFGFRSGGNPEAILCSMPPSAAW